MRKNWTLITLTPHDIYEALMELGFTEPFNDLSLQDQQLIIWAAQVKKDAE